MQNATSSFYSLNSKPPFVSQSELGHAPHLAGSSWNVHITLYYTLYYTIQTCGAQRCQVLIYLNWAQRLQTASGGQIRQVGPRVIMKMLLSEPRRTVITARGLQQIREMLQAESQIRETTGSVALPRIKKNPTHTETLPHSCQSAYSVFPPQQTQRTPEREKVEPAAMDGCVSFCLAHPVRGTVCSMLVLSGLVSLTGRNSAVHEPESKARRMRRRKWRVKGRQGTRDQVANSASKDSLATELAGCYLFFRPTLFNHYSVILKN